MARPKVKNKNKNISISLPQDQIKFIEDNFDFNISKFVQIYLKEYMNGN